MQDDAIIRARLLVDDRPLKRAIKRFYAIASCPIEDIDAAYAQFVIDLDSQTVLNGAKARLGGTAASEIASYQAEIARIEAETRESERTIASLKQQLALAQQERKNKIVYDGIAKEALKLPTRAHSAENITRLTSELQTLEAEQKRYAETWASRQEAFSAIVRSLEELGERVREEKSEQERREALGDEDDEAGIPMDAKAKAAAKSGGEDSGTEGEAAHGQKVLDPTAKSFQPSPLAGSALDAASPLPTPGGADTGKADVVSEAAPAMDVDEDGEVVMELLDEEKRKKAAQAKRAAAAGGARERGGEREEGEEDEEEDGEKADSSMQE